MPLTIEIAHQEDGRWLAAVPEIPGVFAYGMSRDEAIEHAQSLALRTLADRVDDGQAIAPQNLFTLLPKSADAAAAFDAASEYVLNKNQELYRRLA